MRQSPILFESMEFRQMMSVAPASSAADPAPAAIVMAATATPKPSNGGITFNEYAGQKFTAKLGEFHLKVSDLALNAVVHWGDGSQSAGVIEGSYATGERYVEGTHKYKSAGIYAVKIDIFAHPIGSPQLATSPIVSFNSVAKVKNLVPTAGGLTLTEHAGEQFVARLGEFKFKSIDLALNAVITWGDGHHSDGKIVGSYATGEWYVVGKHTYANTGKYAVDVKIFAHVIGSPIRPTTPVASFRSVIKVVP